MAVGEEDKHPGERVRRWVMAIAMEQVKVWGIRGGFGHIVMSGEKRKGGMSWARTPHSLHSWMRTQAKPPKRICPECRRMMEELVGVPAKSPQEPRP